jgi:metallo-beta-lactamase class B
VRHRVLLIATSQGLIWLDTGTREMLPTVQSSIVKLGFQLQDVKILLTSHAHRDHVEGHTAMKHATGAQVMAIAEEAPALSSGKDLSAVADIGREPVAIDRELHDGDGVVLGDVTMHAVLTAGHTPGCTTWTTTARDGGRSYSVVFACVPQEYLADCEADLQRRPQQNRSGRWHSAPSQDTWLIHPRMAGLGPACA